MYFTWAVILGAVSAVSLPLGSLVGLNVRFRPRTIAAFAAFGAGALIAALSVELVAPTAIALTEANHGEVGSHALADFFALVVGGVLGGLLFVALDAVVNRKGGHVRKTSATLAFRAKRDREEVNRLLQGVLTAAPFDALPPDLTPTLASMLSPVAFQPEQVLSIQQAGEAHAYIVLEGEVEVEIRGQDAARFGPGTLVGLLMLLVPDLETVGKIRAKAELKCLALSRSNVQVLKDLSPAFDRACRELAAQRMGQVEEHLATRLPRAVAWSREAATALRRGAEAPALKLRRAHEGHEGSPLAVWLGILLDGIPESLVIGAGLYVVLLGHATPEDLRFVEVIPYTLVAGLFLSNFPEALSSSANMLAQGWTRRRVFLMWFALMVTTAVGAGFGFLLAGVLSETWLVFAEGVAAGAMLTMIAAAMIPEAAAHGRPSVVGLSTLAGFLAAVLFKLLE